MFEFENVVGAGGRSSCGSDQTPKVGIERAAGVILKAVKAGLA
jgi:hypothetical protein